MITYARAHTLIRASARRELIVDRKRRRVCRQKRKRKRNSTKNICDSVLSRFPRNVYDRTWRERRQSDILKINDNPVRNTRVTQFFFFFLVKNRSF